MDYIVKQTVGKLLESPLPPGEGQGEGAVTPTDAAKIKILDPACGSGSFLLGAYQHLLDWHLKWYVNNGAEKHARGKDAKIRPADKPFLAQPVAGALLTPSRGTPGEGKGEGRIPPLPPGEGQGEGTTADEVRQLGHWALTTRERKRILLDNIHGVDIDYQAVEVTKLSLLLRCLEGETAESLRGFMTLFRERALPDLGKNIQCGNSLIGTDIMNSPSPSGRGEGGTVTRKLTEEEIRRINPFDYERAFPQVFKGKDSGFDAVIGNPPYVFGRDWTALGISEVQKKHLGEKFSSSPYQLDMFSLFMEQAFRLCGKSGFVGQIVPNVWLTNTYSSRTRGFYLSQATDICIVVPPRNVFEGIVVDTVVYTLRKTGNSAPMFRLRSIDRLGNVKELFDLETAKYVDGSRPISTSVLPESMAIAEGLVAKHSPLGSLAEMTRGVHPYRTGGYGQTAFGSGVQTQRDVDERPYHSCTKKPGFRAFIYGKDLARYAAVKPSDYVRYGPWLAEPREAKFFEGERNLFKKDSRGPVGCHARNLRFGWRSASVRDKAQSWRS